MKLRLVAPKLYAYRGVLMCDREEFVKVLRDLRRMRDNGDLTDKNVEFLATQWYS